MPLEETAPPIEVQALLLDEKAVALTPAPQRPVLRNRIVVVGNYLPRRCGIATLTTDLCDALHAEYGTTELLALPVMPWLRMGTQSISITALRIQALHWHSAAYVPS
jgi:hypothetical protein